MIDHEHLAARYASTLSSIVAVLGPEHICGCEFHPSDCGLPEEAEEALKLAKDALAGRSEMDEQISFEVMARAKALRRFGTDPA